jgi:surfeit locus 1 family protein
MRHTAIARILSIKWLSTTFLVLTATFVMVRLGFWQLDRLEKRREFNTRVIEQTSQQTLNLNEALNNVGVDNQNLINMEYRQVQVTGEYDFEYEVALRNQIFQNQYGVHLLTPLKIEGTDIWVLVDRGWIPGSDFESGMVTGGWPKFAQLGTVEVNGILRSANEKPDFGRISDPDPISGGERVMAWNLANLPQMQKQIPYPILPVYIMQLPDPTWSGLPFRSKLELELTEGPHLGYAIQWFTFATILFFGYPVFLFHEIRITEPKKPSHEKTKVTPGEHVNV